MAPIKKGGKKKKGHSVTNKMVKREYTVNIHKHIHGAVHPSGTLGDRKICHKGGEGLQTYALIRAQQSCLGQRQKEYPFRVHVQLSRKGNEDEESSEKLCALVTYNSVQKSPDSECK